MVTTDKKMFSYIRDIESTKNLEYGEKFAEFIALCEKAAATDGVDIVSVAYPEILGDNYDEVMINLCHAAHAGLKVAVANSSLKIHNSDA